MSFMSLRAGTTEMILMIDICTYLCHFKSVRETCEIHSSKYKWTRFKQCYSTSPFSARSLLISWHLPSFPNYQEQISDLNLLESKQIERKN